MKNIIDIGKNTVKTVDQQPIDLVEKLKTKVVKSSISTISR